MTTSTYPVHVDARLDPGLSRWQWLVKWVLVIPHYLVLALLWLAFVVLSVVAFFAILFTGRYPRAIFDFNVGVLRWSWRVAYYAYGALGTDRYPPFSLRERPDYPTHLEVDYPEHLSRGLVLVKWWLLAIPHYLVIGFFLGGGLYVAYDASDSPWLWGGGLIGLLVLVAGIMLLFTGRYPQPIFDLVLGMNRWVLRVAAYAGLMTDEYPPFRLDQGGSDPGGRLTLPPGPAPAPPGAPVARPGWTAGRVVALVAGALVLLGSLGIGAGGATLAFADTAMRDDAGFVMSGRQVVTTDTYAVVSTNLAIHTDVPSASLPQSLLGDVKVTATGTGADPVFLGIARTEDARAYLRGVPHATVLDLDPDPAYRTSGGTATPGAPTRTDIWVASSAGTGTRSVVWPVEDGDWTVVVMRADGTAGVRAAVAAGATVPVLDWLVPVLLAAAGLGLVVAVLLMVFALRAAGRAPVPASPAGTPTEGGAAGR